MGWKQCASVMDGAFGGCLLESHCRRSDMAPTLSSHDVLHTSPAPVLATRLQLHWQCAPNLSPNA
eukprot:130795-Chlamydomonas_euryale.AAC.3